MSMNRADADILSTNNIKPIISYEDVENILNEDYGLENLTIKNLIGYDDKNFLVKVEKNVDNDYITKICKDGYDCALVFLSNKEICCPKPVKTKRGEYLTLRKFISGQHIVRILEFIPGSLLVDVECTPNLCYESGAFIAKLNEALKDFKHKGYEDRNTLWMMINVPKLSEFLFAVKDTKKQRLVTEVIEAFSSRVISKSDEFEKGLIHGDFNEQNILVKQEKGRWYVKGALDFGDSHIACFLYDVAITMTYIILHAKDLDRGGYVLAGYNSIRPLSSQEIQLLKVCICARMCQSLVLGAFTFSRDPSNTYVLRTAEAGWTLLEKLWSIPDEVIINRWLEICNSFVYE
ncbi:hypothetical protein HHI36_001974 [Cryptolaemus montrouzieri]|uniref:Hydroxylysine kinase n=1 Tax=Cryptolaemus montrouzieri TaxID=559131 RepID=A0ABD2P982_9CUCU